MNANLSGTSPRDRPEIVFKPTIARSEDGKLIGHVSDNGFEHPHNGIEPLMMVKTADDPDNRHRLIGNHTEGLLQYALGRPLAAHVFCRIRRRQPVVLVRGPVFIVDAIEDADVATPFSVEKRSRATSNFAFTPLSGILSSETFDAAAGGIHRIQDRFL
jgi:hypothetical protein